MSDSVRPHTQQPTRLLCPWDSPGKDTGVGCHFLLQCMKVKSQSEVAQSCQTPSDPMDCSPPGSSVHGIFQASFKDLGKINSNQFLLTQGWASSQGPTHLCSSPTLSLYTELGLFCNAYLKPTHIGGSRHSTEAGGLRTGWFSGTPRLLDPSLLSLTLSLHLSHRASKPFFSLLYRSFPASVHLQISFPKCF